MSNTIQSGLVSTIIPVFNRPCMIIEAVKSVLDQDYRPIEIIVVDDGSTDNTFEVLTQLQKQHAELTVLQQQNAGPGVAREYARQHARGEYLQYLDSDDVLLPTKFSLQVDALNTNPESVVAYGKTQRVEVAAQLTDQVWKGTGDKVANMFPGFLRWRWWGTSTPLYRRSETDKAGAWLSLINEEDWEYDSRIAALGGKLACIDQFVSVQRSHDDHLSSDGDQDIKKLRHRCKARHAIYQNAMSYGGDIALDDWLFFAKSVFLLARQCARAGLCEQSNSLVKLSCQVYQDHDIRHPKQTVFTFLSALLGCRVAAGLSKLIECCRKDQ